MPTDRSILEKARPAAIRAFFLSTILSFFLLSCFMNPSSARADERDAGGISASNPQGISVPSFLTGAAMSAVLFLAVLAAMRARRKRRMEDEIRLLKEQLAGEALKRAEDLRDAKERLEREIDVRTQAEAVLRAVIDTITETVLLLDPDGRVLMANETAAKRLKGSPSEIEGKIIFDLFPPELKASRTKAFEEVKARARAVNTVDQREGRTYETIWHPVFDRDGVLKFVSVFAIDTTELRKAEDDRTKTEKLESIGLLAGGIAHDFNNLLTGIMGFVDLSMTSAEPGSRQHRFLSEAMNLCHKAKDLTRRFTTFAKGGDPLMRPTNLAALLRDTVSLLLSGSSLEADLTLAPDLMDVDCDPAQMRDVLASIITNSMEAMPGGGRIEIKAENMKELPEGLEVRPSSEGRGWLHVSIRDFGIGISKENLGKLFLPYFSTKQRGAQKGMGLSLPSAYAIMKRHGGAISVESEQGKGTTVHLYLPESRRPAPAPDHQKLAKEGPERILLMDDEETVLEVAGSILKQGGFEVTPCRDGREAISLFGKALEEGRPFTGVILDLTIRGGMGARDVVKELLSMDPEVKALVSSGYSDDPVMSNYAAFGFCGAVSKPYDIRGLLRAANRAFRSHIGKSGPQSGTDSGDVGN